MTTRLRPALAACLVAALAGCAGTIKTPPIDAIDTIGDQSAAAIDDHMLFIAAWQNVIDYHLNPATPQAMAMAGLGRLSLIDPLLSVAQRGDTVVLRDDGAEETFPAPPTASVERWAQLTVTVLNRARRGSPTVTAMPADRLEEQVIEGGLTILDPFSHYARPEVARERRALRNGYGGLGIAIGVTQGDIVVTAVQPETPAAAADIRVGDHILTIDGAQAAWIGGGVAAINGRLRGDPGTTVHLTLWRRGRPNDLDLTVTRGLIVDPSVALILMGDVAWIRVSTFNQRTAGDFTTALHRAHQTMGGGLRGIVLDLRDNSGGLLDQAVTMAGSFLDGGMVATTTGRHPESIQQFPVPPNPSPETLPLVVLVDGISASASEVIAAALQDRGRAVVIGTASFGKGTVQNVIPMANDGEMTVSWAELLTPRGYHLHHHGVIPTVCTSGVTSDAMAALLDRPPAPVLFEARDRLDEGGWLALRDQCPAATKPNAVDIGLAEHLLDTPALYQAALKLPAASIAEGSRGFDRTAGSGHAGGAKP